MSIGEDKKNIRILLVDDEESIRYTLKIFLEREGYGSITTAATIQEARLAVENSPFDLVISDIVLEDGSGTDFLHHIQKIGVECPVVMITGFPHLDSAAEALRYGAFDYISKPVNKQTLLRFVRQALKHWRLQQEKKELQKENEKYRRYLEVIFSSVSDAIITVDNKMNIVQLNDTARKWLHDPDIKEIHNLAQLPGEMASACLDDAREVVARARTVREHQVECLKSNGETRMISLNAAPLRDDIKEFVGAVIVARDITVGGGIKDEKRRNEFQGFIGCSSVMQGIYKLIENVGKVDTAVLVTGESGTGKELAAEALHNVSLRKEMPLVKVDCASVAEDLLESELFGHLKGAFTGADRDRPGRLLQADGGTLFLDEIGDISPRMQLRLLRFLQEKTFTPVGQDTPVHVDVRVIAATNVDLKEHVRDGRFREDLYYRLKVVEILLPPLRERQPCVPLLVHHFLAYFSDKLGRRVYSVSDQAMQLLSAYTWPGNVRELRHVIERGCVICDGRTIQREHLPPELLREISDVMPAAIPAQDHEIQTAHKGRTEYDILHEMLARAGGNKSKAARLLGMDRSTLYRKLKKYQTAAE